MMKSVIPPNSKANPEPALAPIVGFIFPNMMMPMAPDRVAVRIHSAPSNGLLAPFPGE